MSRGDRREDVFLDDVDRQDFLEILAETCQKTGFQVHAYCLMRNRFHLVAMRRRWRRYDDAAQVDWGASAFGHVQERQQQTSPLDEGEPETGGGRSRGVC